MSVGASVQALRIAATSNGAMNAPLLPRARALLGAELPFEQLNQTDGTVSIQRGGISNSMRRMSNSLGESVVVRRRHPVVSVSE